MDHFKTVVYVTAHDPLKRFDTLLETLRGYLEIPGEQDVFVYVDWEHREDADVLGELLASELNFNRLVVQVAGPEWEGFSLCWAHKESLKRDIRDKSYDFYVYTENDMLFRSEHFLYWHSWKDRLKELNLEPGFCRFEKLDTFCIPFDNHRVWNLNGPTKSVWGDRPYVCDTYLTPHDEIIGFASLGNPYGGMMILDQEMADVYVDSLSADPVRSFERCASRCWPIADRSSLGTAFENLLPGQEHRRVVPLIRGEFSVQIAPYALLEHKDTKYSTELLHSSAPVLDVSTMFQL